MNDLQRFLQLTNGDESFYMALLHGYSNCPISDNCVTAADVWPEDAKRAVVRIMGRPYAGVEAWVRGGWE